MEDKNNEIYIARNIPQALYRIEDEVEILKQELAEIKQLIVLQNELLVEAVEDNKKKTDIIRKM